MFKRKKRGQKLPQPTVAGIFQGGADFPLEVLANLPELILRGNRELVTEHCSSILTYTDREISLRAKKLILTVRGEELSLKVLTVSTMSITGVFESIHFSREDGAGR